MFRKNLEGKVEGSGGWNSSDESPQKLVRTFGDETSFRNVVFTPEKTASSDSTSRFAKEMKMLGHDLANSPNASKGKNCDMIIWYFVNLTEITRPLPTMSYFTA